MKTAYLINKQQPDGAMRFAIADSGEWLSAVAENEQLPSEQRRYFIRDSRGKLFCNDPPAQMVLLPSHNRK